MPCADTKEEVVELDEYHAHEALDRTCMFMEIVETQLLNHPYIQADDTRKTLVLRALKNLDHLHKLIGIEHL